MNTPSDISFVEREHQRTRELWREDARRRELQNEELRLKIEKERPSKRVCFTVVLCLLITGLTFFACFHTVYHHS